MTKLCEREVLQLLGKTFAVFVSSVWNMLTKIIAQNIRRENFPDSLKFCKTFLSCDFCYLRYMHTISIYYLGIEQEDLACSRCFPYLYNKKLYVHAYTPTQLIETYRGMGLFSRGINFARNA